MVTASDPEAVFRKQRLEGIDRRYRWAEDAYRLARDRVTAVLEAGDHRPGEVDRNALLREVRAAIETLELALGIATHAALVHGDDPGMREQAGEVIARATADLAELYTHFDPYGGFGIQVDEL